MKSDTPIKVTFKFDDGDTARFAISLVDLLKGNADINVPANTEAVWHLINNSLRNVGVVNDGVCELFEWSRRKAGELRPSGREKSSNND